MAKISLLLVLAALLLQDIATGQGIDQTRIPEADGIDVVFASISLIRDSRIFPDDNRFLRRLAYVETRDGVAISTFRPGYFGGIWQVDEAIYNKTVNINNPELADIHRQIFLQFGIDWVETTWQNLLAPLFSALAARIYLTTIADNDPIPDIGDLEGQGQYWLDFYSSDPSDTVQMFINDVNEFELQECPIRGIDLAFVFDSSGSVGRSNFQRELDFAIQVTKTFNVGPDETRIASIAYSGFARIPFFFDTFTNRTDVTDALGEIEYMNVEVPPGSRRGTNTADALTRLRNEVFSEMGGAREQRFAVPQVAVVITDGQSNVNASETIPSAERLHNDSVVVFGVGVGNRINMEELRAIASDEDFMVLLDSFDVQELANLQRTISAEACIVPAPVDIDLEIEGTLLQGASSFFQFQLPSSGMTLRLASQSGRSVMYASSKIRNPNSAFHDFRYDSGADAGGLFIDPGMLVDDARKRRDTDGMIARNFTDTTLYVTVQGLDNRNMFTLVTTFGNTSSSTKLMAVLSTLCVFLVITFASFL